MTTAITDRMTDVLVPSGADKHIELVPDPEPDHPDGAGIRRQVEFYFSDDNLPTDLHLLQCCGGRENLPVSISRVCGFKKMRGYKPKALVVAALRKSTFLEVSDDSKTIKRKLPLQAKCLLDEDFFDGDGDDIAYDPRSLNPRLRQPAVYPVPIPPQKKAEHPKGTSKNMLKPTGFEKTYVEAPKTLHEAEEEEALYDPHKSFIERIEIAIQRFKQKRRMHEMYAHVFNKLMRFGGVESGLRMHQGVSKQELAQMDAEELGRALAIHSVPWDRSDEKQWVVDFVGVGKAFLSSWYPSHYGYAPEAVTHACQVLRSFYNYLLYHDVCPEYKDELEGARKFCDTAEEELPKVNGAGLALPGDFNESASTIFGGVHAGTYTGDKAWAQESKKEGINLEKIGIRDEEARIRFTTGVAIMGSDEQYEKLESKTLKVLTKESRGLEIVAIHPPDELTEQAYLAQSDTLQHKLGKLDPLGKLICRTWVIDDCDEWDLPEDTTKYPGGKVDQTIDNKEYEFWVEGRVLEHCFVGMKMDAKILILDGGLTILDDVNEAMCSFFTWLPNELWMERKPREVRWLKKAMGFDEDEEEDPKDNGEKQGVDNAASDDKFDEE